MILLPLNYTSILHIPYTVSLLTGLLFLRSLCQLYEITIETIAPVHTYVISMDTEFVPTAEPCIVWCVPLWLLW